MEKAAEYEFVPVMSERAEDDLAALEERITSLNAAFAMDFNSGFTGLMKVMEAIFVVRTQREAIDLRLDVMGEVLEEIKKDGQRTQKQEERLTAAREVWDEVKKAYPLLKENVQPAQDAEGERIKQQVRDFSTQVFEFRTKEFLERPMFNFDIGYKKAYENVDSVKLEVDEISNEMDKQKSLADMFEFPELLERSLGLLDEC